MTQNQERIDNSRPCKNFGSHLTPEERSKSCLLLRINRPEVNERLTSAFRAGLVGRDMTPFSRAVLSVPHLGYNLHRLDVGVGKLISPILRHYAEKAHQLIIDYRKNMDKSPMIDDEKITGRRSTSLAVDEHLVKALSEPGSKTELSSYRAAVREFVRVCQEELQYHEVISRLGPLKIPLIGLIGFLLTKYYAFNTNGPDMSCECDMGECVCNPWAS